MVFRFLKRRAYEKNLRKENVPEVFRRSFAQVKNLDTKKSINDVGFVIIDTETTGLSPKKGDELLSLAGIGFMQGRVDLSKSFYEHIKPEGDIPHESVVVHYLTPGKLKGLPAVSDVLTEFFQFCEGDIMVGHHASFDLRFLNHSLDECFGITVANRVVDTALLARAIREMDDPVKVSMEETQHVGLDDLAKEFGISMPDRHDAYGDAFATALIFQRQIGILEKRGVRTLKELMSLGEVR